jgi:hypothetical protein
MANKIVHYLIVVPVILALTACSSLPFIGNQSSANQNRSNSTANSVEDQLAIGILKLEGTDKAVTVEQAKNMLPLWKAVRSLSTGDNTSADEITALYKQIRETMTAEQVQAIQAMNLSQADIQALVQQQGAPDSARPTAGQKSSQTTNSSRSQSSGSGGGMPGGGMPGGPGGMPPEIGGMPGGIPGGAGSGQTSTRSTPSAGKPSGDFQTGINVRLASAVIRLLNQKAGLQP